MYALFNAPFLSLLYYPRPPPSGGTMLRVCSLQPTPFCFYSILPLAHTVLCECVLLSAHTILCVYYPFSPVFMRAPFSRQVINSSREHEDSHDRRLEAPASASLQQLLPAPLLLPAGKIVTHSLLRAHAHAFYGGTGERQVDIQ